MDAPLKDCRAVHFVVPPSQGNVAGIERVTLQCAIGLQALLPDVAVRVHMFGTYRLPADLQGPHVVFHPDDGVSRYGRHLRPAIASDPRAVWIICQPMTLLAILLWNPRFLRRHSPAVILHGGLHIEMRGLRRRLQFAVFARLARAFRLPLAAVSRDLSRYAEHRLGLAPLSVRTLHNPVLSSTAIATVAGSDATRFRCIAVGRLHEQKGFDILIRAWQRSDLDRDAELLILGEGPQRTELEQIIASCSKAVQIRLLGYREDVLEQVRTADLFLMPSRYEGLGGTLIEALSCGIRVVATDYPFGAREALAGGRFGRLVQQPYEDGLVAALNDEYTLWRNGKAQRPDAVALAAHLRKFLRDEAVRQYQIYVAHVARLQWRRRGPHP